MIYVRHVAALANAGIRPKALIHVTGDGLLNLTRVESPASFVLDSVPEPLPVFQIIQSLGGIENEEMYATFNMGIGFCVICSEGESDDCMAALAREGDKVYRLGKVVLDGEQEVRLPGVGISGRGKQFQKM